MIEKVRDLGEAHVYYDRKEMKENKD